MVSSYVVYVKVGIMVVSSLTLMVSSKGRMMVDS